MDTFYTPVTNAQPIASLPNWQSTSIQKIAKLTDRELYKLCQQCGTNLRKFQKEFAGYLPEVEKRRLYKQYNCHTLYEFAAKLAGIKKETVDDIMNVHKKLEDKPALQSLIKSQGWSKIKVVATIATPKTEKFWAETVQTMGKETLKTFVKELRKEAHEVAMNGQKNLFTDIAAQKSDQTADFTKTSSIVSSWPDHSSNSARPSCDGTRARYSRIARARYCVSPEPSTPMETSQKAAITFKLDGEVETKLRIFKQRLEKKTKEPQDWNQTIKALLKIVEQHEVCSKLQSKKPQNQGENQPKIQQNPIPTKEQIQASLPNHDKRYIPARVKHYLHRQYQGTCAYPQCKNPSEILHHTKRFSLESNHDPDFIMPLCKPHERLAHHGLIENEESNPQNWKIEINPNKNSPKYIIDRKVQSYRTSVN